MVKKKILLLLLSALAIFSLAWVLNSQFNITTKIANIGNTPSEAVMNLFQIIRKEGLAATIQKIQVKLSNDPRLGLAYSLQNIESYPPIESNSERMRLPQQKILRSSIPSFQANKAIREDATWYRSNGGNDSNKFSSLKQINRDNVEKLQLAWEYSSSTVSNFNLIETNPIYTNGWLFLTTLNNELICLDASNGIVKWKLSLPGPVAKRGLVWEENSNFIESRIFVSTSRGVYSIFADSGIVEKEFGNAGQVGSMLSLIPPVITKDKVIIALIKPAVEAYDIKTGKLLWSRSLIDNSGDDVKLFTGAVPWGGMSYDNARSQIYISTGNPRPEVIGVTRPGDNDYSSSVISISSETGEILWSFQEISHDLWDLDIPSTPMLSTIKINEKDIDIVATVTKTGNTILLERDFGKPIYDIPYSRVPVSKIPGEITSPYQANFELPEPFLKKVFDPQDITNLSPGSRSHVTNKIRKSKYGFFEPPILGGSIVLYGVTGGASWPGGSIDSRDGTMFVPSTKIPYLIRVVYKDLQSKSRDTANFIGFEEYQNLCSSCHGVDRGGKRENISSGQEFIPSLHGITFLRSQDELSSQDIVEKNHPNKSNKYSNATLKKIYQYLRKSDIAADNDGVMAMNGYWTMLLDQDGFPGSNPPWNFITAIDLTTGKHKWKIPFGTVDLKNDNYKPINGEPKTGSIISTAGNLLFASGTADKKVRALDSTNGKELWSFTLPAPGSAPPMTYWHQGEQYIVIVASGIKQADAGLEGDHVLTFKLSNGDSTSHINLSNEDAQSSPVLPSLNKNTQFKETSMILDGGQIYDLACSSCHNSGVANAPIFGSYTSWIDRLGEDRNILYSNSINGYRGEKGYMPAKGGDSRLTDEQVKSAVNFMMDAVVPRD